MIMEEMRCDEGGPKAVFCPKPLAGFARRPSSSIGLRASEGTRGPARAKSLQRSVDVIPTLIEYMLDAESRYQHGDKGYEYLASMDVNLPIYLGLKERLTGEETGDRTAFLRLLSDWRVAKDRLAEVLKREFPLGDQATCVGGPAL